MRFTPATPIEKCQFPITYVQPSIGLSWRFIVGNNVAAPQEHHPFH
jgi:hypothetical protein